MLLRIFEIVRAYYNRLSQRLQLLLLQILFYIMYVPIMLLYLLLIINVKYLIPLLMTITLIILCMYYCL
jgi:hypothetical protein